MAKRTTRAPSTTRKTTSRSTRKATALASEVKAEDLAEELNKPLPEVLSVAAHAEMDAEDADTDSADDDNELRKRELIDLVVARSEVKKKFAKPAVEAMLAILGEAISEGRSLNLSPFGKLKVNRTNEKGNGQVIVCKLRRSTQDGTPVEKLGQDPLAEPAE
ncbi:HU family DNA-binding protein [Ruegeria marina]|uniref:DNA-binding protein HU-alpha n=1 Tax=Ruegeria marina TaxID=639004 RepID=A0A1G6QAM9_9RHOB|nr:HU family DNA-binding protein [Ruegeria marina]SDC89540.1 DNA-binding protein HU-alpha [Ruegeria marina]